MKPKPHTRDRLKQLADQNKDSLAALARIIDRPEGYLQRYVRIGEPSSLAPVEVDLLARYFGVRQEELFL